MSDFQNYLLAQSRQETAVAEHNRAVASLENAQIKTRLAEIKSQSQPVDGIISSKLSERDRLYAAAFYAVTGRLPLPEGEL